MIIEKSAGVAIYRRNKGQLEYLLIQSRQNHHWRFPKGDVEGEESLAEAAEREAFEKVGLRPKFDFTFHKDEIYLISEDTWKEVTLYPAEFVAYQKIKLDPQKVTQYQWATYTHAMQLVEFLELKDTLTAINNYVKNSQK